MSVQTQSLIAWLYLLSATFARAHPPAWLHALLDGHGCMKPYITVYTRPSGSTAQCAVDVKHDALTPCITH